MEQHAFWKTQPIVETVIIPESEFGSIEDSSTKEIKTESCNLPSGFEFYTLNLDDENELIGLQTFLNNNYLEMDDENMKFAYSIESIKWITQCPNYFPELAICVRTCSSKQIIATIFGTPVMVKVYNKIIPQVEINLLCVNKKFRNKNLAPVMIKEVTRRTNLRGLFQAVYTTGLVLPNKLCTARYYHRLINVKRMSSIGFYNLPTDNMSMYEKLYRIPVPKLDSEYKIRPMEISDVDICLEKLNIKLSQYKLTRVFDKENFIHYFLPNPNVNYTWVIEKNNVVTDMISFYIIDNTVLNNPHCTRYKAGYLYYFFNESLELGKLINIGLFYAKEVGVDVFNILNMFDLDKIITDCKFLGGSGYLHYYLYNYKCNSLNFHELAFPMF
jgi:glycylpeptide N-tetradecanoyltransferase